MQALLARDAIVVDGRPVGKSHRLVAGTVIELLDEPAVGAPPDGDAGVAVDVRYADDDVIVVAKPAGLVVHSGAGHADGTLVNGLLARFPEIAVGRRRAAARASCTGSTATRAACSSWRGPRARTRASSQQISAADRRAPVRRAGVGRARARRAA